MKRVRDIGSRLFIFMFTVIGVFLLFSQKVSADVIWEPRDSFYEEHREECEYINRRFTTFGPENKVVVYKSPVSNKAVKELENGVTMYVSFVYTDARGIEWGLYEEDAVTGWFPMDYVTVVYDYLSFAEDFKEFFVKEEGQVSSDYKGKEIYFWNYPGSTEGMPLMTLEDDNVPSYSQTFTDEQGRKWGYVGYHYGIKNMWLCLDAPTADYETLYPEGAPIQEEIAEAENAEDMIEADNEDVDVKETDRIVPQDSSKNYIGVAAGLVLLVVVVTAGLLKKLKNKGGENAH